MSEKFEGNIRQLVMDILRPNHRVTEVANLRLDIKKDHVCSDGHFTVISKIVGQHDTHDRIEITVRNSGSMLAHGYCDVRYVENAVSFSASICVAS